MKKSGCLPIALFLGLCLSLFLNVLLGAALSARVKGKVAPRITAEQRFIEQIVEPGAGSGKIAVIPLVGIIGFEQQNALGANLVDDFKAALQQAKEDPDVTAVVVSTDSPGGEITASDVLYKAIQDFAKEKPVVYYMNSIGASGAYYAACGSTWMMCNDTTFTGSIGVIISALNYRELFGKVGLESVVFKSGKFKDMLNGARELTPEESAYIQGLVMQSYDRFLGIVADKRKLSADSLRSGPADGRILSGTDALAQKLVDQLGYIEDAYAKARELGESPEAEIVRYRRSFSFSSFFDLLGESRATKVELNLPGREVKLEPGRIYLLPALFVP
ncbi:MAG TPA: signal peptide peptidase SppA [Chthoniobacterales bacterium]